MRNNQLISDRRSVSIRRLNNSISHFFCFLTPFQYNGCNHSFFMLPTYQSKINTHSHWACNDSSTPKMFTLNTSCESAIWWCYILKCKREELQCVQYVYKWTASFFATFCKQAVTLFVQTQMTALHPSVLSSLCQNVNYLHIFPLSWCPIVNVGLIKRLWLLADQIPFCASGFNAESLTAHLMWVKVPILTALRLSATPSSPGSGRNEAFTGNTPVITASEKDTWHFEAGVLYLLATKFLLAHPSFAE